jgi:parallel beta-helix repeat protein
MTSGPSIDHNQVTRSTFNGIVLDTTTGAKVNYNTTDNNGSGNPGDGGIALLNSTNNTVAHNESKNNHGDGIFADPGSTGNTFDHNELGGNTKFDAEDLSTGEGTAGTGNTWSQNHGTTSSPSGLVS